MVDIYKSLKRADIKRQKKIGVDRAPNISRPNDMDYRMPSVGRFPTDTCWLFTIMKRKINAYTHLSEFTKLNDACIPAIQVGQGPVQKVDAGSLADVIKGNIKAMKALKTKEYDTDI